MSQALSQLPNTQLDDLPRMADFAIWATACEQTLWNDGAFQTAYFNNIDGATETIIEADSIANSVCDFMADRNEWEGTAAFLLAELSGIVPERITKSRTWPDTPRSMSGRLRRAAQVLRKVGLDIGFPTSHKHGRILTLSHRLDNGGKFASPPSTSSPHDTIDNNINCLSGDGRGDGTVPLATPLPSPGEGDRDKRGTVGDGRKIVPSPREPLKNNANIDAGDGGDGGDGASLNFSKEKKELDENGNEWKGLV